MIRLPLSSATTGAAGVANIRSFPARRSTGSVPGTTSSAATTPSARAGVTARQALRRNIPLTASPLCAGRRKRLSLMTARPSPPFEPPCTPSTSPITATPTASRVASCAQLAWVLWKSSSSNTRHGYLIFRGSQCFCCRLLKFLGRRFLLVTGRLRENTGTFRGVNTANSQQDKAQWWL